MSGVRRGVFKVSHGRVVKRLWVGAEGGNLFGGVLNVKYCVMVNSIRITI